MQLAAMNCRHGFHAGNFADDVKHATLVRILHHLCAKPAAFRVMPVPVSTIWPAWSCRNLPPR
jgi:hypothetical protein